MSILVTGGTGFLGSALVKRLVRLGYTVRVLDNSFRSSVDSLSDVIDKIEYCQADIRDAEQVFSAMEGIETVIHLAAINGTEFFYSKPDLVLDVGVRGILNVIEGCKKAGIRKLLAASSSEVYQSAPQVPTDESAPLIVPDPLNPRYSYGGSKIITELLVINQCKKDFDQAVLFRPHNVYGPKMGWEHVLPQFILRAKELIEKNATGPIAFPIQGDGKETRAFMHIDDMVDGICLLMEKGEHLNIYHVGNPEEVAIRDVAKKVVEYMGRECQIVPGPLTMGSTRRRCPSIEKMKALGFSPKICLNDGLGSIIDWYVKNSDQKKLTEAK